MGKLQHILQDIALINTCHIPEITDIFQRIIAHIGRNVLHAKQHKIGRGTRSDRCGKLLLKLVIRHNVHLNLNVIRIRLIIVVYDLPQNIPVGAGKHIPEL